MFAILFLICMGQLLALGLHSATWWLRQHALRGIAGFGFLCFALAVLVSVFVFVSEPFDHGELTQVQLETRQLAMEQATREFTFYAILFCVGTSVLGLYHIFLLGRNWRWTTWLSTTLAVWAELGFATLSGFVIQNDMIAPLRQKLLGPIPNISGSFFGYSWKFDWALPSFLITLLLLALFRPFLCKFARGLFDITKRETSFSQDSS